MSSNSKSLAVSSDEDLIFLAPAFMGIKNDLQKKKRKFYVWKKNFEKFKGKSFEFFYI